MISWYPLKKGKFDLKSGSWMTDYRLCKRKILFYVLYLPSFFLVFYIWQKIGTEPNCRRSCCSASKWCCLLRNADTKFRVNTVTLLSLFFDSLLGLNLRKGLHLQSVITWIPVHDSFVFLFYVDCQSKKWTYLFKKLVVLKGAIDFYSYFTFHKYRLSKRMMQGK